MKEKITAKARKFKQELNKAMNTAIIAAFGFIIALVWKDLIVEYVNLISSASPVQGKLITALIVTVVSVIGILIVTKIFSENQ